MIFNQPPKPRYTKPGFSEESHLVRGLRVREYTGFVFCSLTKNLYLCASSHLDTVKHVFAWGLIFEGVGAM